MRNYRDLVALRAHLTEWLGKLEAFDNMIDTRREGYARNLPAIEQRLAAIDSDALYATQQSLQSQLDAIAAQRDVAALATAAEADQWRRLEALENNPAWDTAESSAARDKQRVLKGTLLWELDREYGYRLWLQRQSVEDTAQRLATVRALEARTTQVRAEMPVELDTFAARIEALQPRIKALTVQIDEVLNGQARQLEHIVVQELETRRERLASYRLQARFALASIYDQATVRSAESSGGQP